MTKKLKSVILKIFKGASGSEVRDLGLLMATILKDQDRVQLLFPMIFSKYQGGFSWLGHLF